MLSTLGMNQWKVKKINTSTKKESEIKDKNKRQYQQIIKYENIIKQRYETKLNTIRIDGKKDKIHDRHQKPPVKQKGLPKV